MGCVIKYKGQSIPEEQFLQYLNKQIAINQLFETNSNLANQVYEALGFDINSLSYAERAKKYKEFGIKKSDGTKITEQDIEQNPTFYQNNTNQTTEEFVASEKTIRDLAARMSDRIGIPVRFESDKTKKYKGKLENVTAVVNLAYATLDTPIHEILGHPIIRAIKGNNFDSSDFQNWLKIRNKGQFNNSRKDYSSDEQYINVYKKEIEEYTKETGKTLYTEKSQLYQNLLKELEYGRGKEILDRIKRDYKDKPARFAKDDYGNELYLISPSDAYSLEEQQEEAIVELLGLMVAEKLDKVKDGKLISLLKRLLKEMKAFVRSLLNQKEVEIDKLPDNMTLGDIADLLAYSNSKLILPGNEVVYTTPDNQQFKTYAEASNHISQLAKSVEEVDLSDVSINDIKIDKNNLPSDFKNYYTSSRAEIAFMKDGRYNDEYNNKIQELKDKYAGKFIVVEKSDYGVYPNTTENQNFYNTKEEADNAALDKSIEQYKKEKATNGFIEKNKQYEQSKEIIEEWKKINNIRYNPEEVYSRGQEFVSVVGAYSNFDVNLMMQNLLQHIEDNEKAGGKFAISAFTKPIDRLIPHLEGGGGKIKFKIYPQSNDILWAANTDVFSGSVWDASEKVSKDKKSELLGVSYTKYPSLSNVNNVQLNLASIIDDLEGHHNELGISLTGNNFRLEYDENIPYSTKKIINSINSILDQRYGKLVKPEIKKIGGGIQPTQTNETLKESIENISEKIQKEEQLKSWQVHEILEGKAKKADFIKEKEYTEQALINTKIAKLKEIAKKYPRSLIRSEVRLYKSNSENQNLFDVDELPFQLVTGKELTPKQQLEEKMKKQKAQQLYSKYLDTIFPNSKVKDIVYHGTFQKIDKFDKSKLDINDSLLENDDKGFQIRYDLGKVFYFGNRNHTSVQNAKNNGGNVISAILDFQNPIKVSDYTKREAIINRKNYDSAIGIKDEEIEYGAFEPEQIHILGSKQDIENFSKFVKNKSNNILSISKPEIVRGPINYWEQEDFKKRNPNYDPFTIKVEPFIAEMQPELEPKLESEQSDLIRVTKEFLKKAGIKEENIYEHARKHNIELNEKTKGFADIMRGVVAVVEGSEDEVFAEEALHFAIAIIKDKHPSLYKQLTQDVRNYKIYDETFKEYSNQYLINGKTDIERIKEEAATKLLVQVLNQEYGGEKPKLIKEAETLWEKIKQFLFDLFRNNSYSKAIKLIQSGNLNISDINSEHNIMFNLSGTELRDEMFNVISEKEKMINIKPSDKRKNEKGNPLDVYFYGAKELYRRVSDVSKQMYDKWAKNNNITKSEWQKAIDDLKAEKGTDGHKDIEHIISILTDENGYLLENPKQDDYTPKTNNQTYNTLKEYVFEKLKQYPNARIKTEVKIANPDKVANGTTGVGGTIDVLIFTQNGELQILDWKFMDINTEKTQDLPFYKIKAFNSQMNGYKTILSEFYGIPKDKIKSQIIPIKANYTYYRDNTKLPKFTSIEVGDVDASKIEQDYLIHVGVLSHFCQP